MWEAAGGRIKYLGAKCFECGVFLEAAGQGDVLSQVEDSALDSLRVAWVKQREALDAIKSDGGGVVLDCVQAATIYKQQSIKRSIEARRARRK